MLLLRMAGTVSTLYFAALHTSVILHAEIHPLVRIIRCLLELVSVRYYQLRCSRLL